MTSPKNRNVAWTILVLFLLTGTSFALYWHTIGYPFVFDDLRAIPENTEIRLDELSAKSLIECLKKQKNRRVARVSFAVNYYLSGIKPDMYRITNIVIHALCGFMVYLLMRSLIDLNLRSQSRRVTVRSGETHTRANGVTNGKGGAMSRLAPAAFVIAIIWATHPIQTNSVTYIVQRMNSLAVLFYVTALWLYIRGRLAGKLSLSITYIVLSCAAWVVALNCKEIAVTLPLVVALTEWYFFLNVSVRQSLKILVSAVVSGVLCAGLVGAVVVAMMGTNVTEKISRGYVRQGFEFTAGERVLSETRVLVFYLSQLIYPNPGRMNLDHDFRPSRSIADMHTILSIVLLTGLFLIALKLARNHPLVSFGILWFFIHLIVESSVIPLKLVYEHRLYMPSIGVFLALAAMYYQIFRFRRAATALAGPVLVAVILSGITYQRNKVWQSERRLWQDIVGKSPNLERPNNNYGNLLANSGEIEEGLKYLKRAAEINPNFTEAHSNMAAAYIRIENYENALYHCNRAIESNTKYAKAYINKGIVLNTMGRREESVESYRKAVELEPLSVEGNYNLGYWYFDKRDFKTSIFHFRQTLKKDPYYIEALNGLGAVYYMMNQYDEAYSFYSRALKYNPDYMMGYFNLGMVLERQDKLREAVTNYKRALELNPNHEKAYYLLGDIYVKQNMPDNARECYEHTLRVNPNNRDAARKLKALNQDTDK